MDSDTSIIRIFAEHLKNIGFKDEQIQEVNKDQINIIVGDARLDANTHMQGTLSISFPINPYDHTHNFDIIDPMLLPNATHYVMELLMGLKEDFILEQQNAIANIELANNLIARIAAYGKDVNMHSGTTEVGQINMGQGTS